MDIELLSNMLRELITRNESVSLHSMGTFVATDMPSVFSDRGFSILPPYRKINFLQGAGDGDELLVCMYSEVNGVPFEHAKAIVHHYLSELKGVLADTKSIAFPGLGRLRMTRQNSIFFIQDEDASVYPDGFGLASVSLKSHAPFAYATPETTSEIPASAPAEPVPEPEAPTTEPEAPTTEPEVPTTEPEAPSPAPLRKTSRWWIWPAVIVGVAVFALALFLILARTAPDFIDSLLYTPEELRILNW